jgi:AAA+ ATPase superfamily predicted ATPase
MVDKPSHVFDRDDEWASLLSYASDPHPGAMLGVVSGRRRQGKSYLLEALATATGGFYFPALEATESVALRNFTEALIRYTGQPVRIPFRDWGDAIPHLFAVLRDRPVPVVFDEFPFLTKASPSLPSILQRELGPGGSGRESMARVLLCGSAMSVMGKLLAGQAPLRGRAALEILLRPFGYRDAARFWGMTDPHLAVLLHAVVGGTPAYRQEFVRFDAPAGIEDFDDWVVRTVLNRQTPLFREARYLLAEEADIRDPALYHSVLAAVAEGNRTWSGIAKYVGRKSPEISHPLNVLEDCGLLGKEPDAFRSGRSSYRIIEPLITFYQAVMRPDWSRLELGDAAAVWRDQRAVFQSQVVGPHFEALCRDFALRAAPAVFGGSPGEVRSGVVNDTANRTQIEIDVVVFAPARAGQPRRILSLGEAKWGRVMDSSHVARLARARDLLAVKGYDTTETVLACYSGAGFADELRAGTRDGHVALIDTARLYAEHAPNACL